MRWLELTQGNGRKVLIHLDNVVRILALANGQADFIMTNGSITVLETYLVVKAKIKTYNPTFVID